MNERFYLRLLVVALLITMAFLTSGCSSLLIGSTKPVTQYLGTGPDGRRCGHGVPRSQVIKQFGTPVATKTFTPPISVGQARSQHIVSFLHSHDGTELEAFLRIGRIDEFRIRGPVQDSNAVEGYHITRDLALWTLGLSEVVCFPLALYGYAGTLNSVTRIYVLYYPDGTVLYQTNNYQVTSAQLKERL